MIKTGVFLLYAALITLLYGMISGVYGIRHNHERTLKSSRWARTLSAIAVFGAVLVLWRALVTSNFSFAYVARYTNSSLPLIYKISALWAGQSGSLLLWLMILSIITLVVYGNKRYQQNHLNTKINFIVDGLRLLFLVILIFIDAIFSPALGNPVDGQGLNPMLQSLGMVVHPPLLFLGFSGFVVPFALAVISLAERKASHQALQTGRPWVLFSWLFLTSGIITGGQWAYTELGWGGYWAWDPIENASLFPWLTSTVLLHNLINIKYSQQTKFSSYLLVGITFLLTIFSTFLTRSGVLDSVHAFSDGLMGMIFLVVILVILATYGYLLISRRQLLTAAPDSGEGKLLAKETAIKLGNLMSILILVGVFLGTMFPIISPLFSEREIVLDAGFYNRISVPLWLIWILFMGLFPTLDWHATSKGVFIRRMIIPLVASVIAGLIGWWIKPALIVVISTMIGIFSLTTHLQDLISQLVKAPKVLSRQVRKVGGYIIHLGVILILFGILGSSVFVTDTFVVVEPGDEINFGAFTLHYDGLLVLGDWTAPTIATTLDIYRDSEHISHITSDKSFVDMRSQPSTNVGIYSTLREDLYLNLVSWESHTAHLHLQRFPLISWIWIGSTLMYLGVLVIGLNGMRKRYSARVSGGDDGEK